MQRDKHYLLVGSFVILTVFAAAIFAVWLAGAQDKDKYQLYRIRFAESVSGLNIGSPVKFRGVDIGKVKTMEIDPDDTSLIRITANIIKTAPIKPDTIATLKLLGITGSVYIELAGGDPSAPNIEAADDKTALPEIKSQPSTISTVMDMLPQITEKISAISDQMTKLLSDKNIASLSDTIKTLQKTSHDASDLTQSLKEHPSRLLWGGKAKKDDDDKGEKEQK